MWPSLIAEKTRAKQAVTGIMDFKYAPYALGDTFTWLANLQVIAHRNDRNVIDLLLISLPESPASPLQPHINSYNYSASVDGLTPAFLCSPMVRSLSIFEKRRKAAQCLLGTILARGVTWPSIQNHFRRKLDYASHEISNAFFNEYGWLPRLQAPFGYVKQADMMRERFVGDKIPVVINIRQRGLTDDPSAVNRDADADAWWSFLERAGHTWPEVKFVLVGGYKEWSRRFARLQNVFIPRMYGYSLGHELAILFNSAFFMGTSSGFSAAATFSDVPYVITKYEHRSAPFVGVNVGDDHLPFAHPYQFLDWRDETENILTELFEKTYDATKSMGRDQQL